MANIEKYAAYVDTLIKETKSGIYQITATAENLSQAENYFFHYTKPLLCTKVPICQYVSNMKEAELFFKVEI